MNRITDRLINKTELALHLGIPRSLIDYYASRAPMPPIVARDPRRADGNGKTPLYSMNSCLEWANVLQHYKRRRPRPLVEIPGQAMLRVRFCSGLLFMSPKKTKKHASRLSAARKSKPLTTKVRVAEVWR